MNIPILVGKHSLEDLIKDLDFGLELKEKQLNYMDLPTYYGLLCGHHGLTAKQMKYNISAYELIKDSENK